MDLNMGKKVYVTHSLDASKQDLDPVSKSHKH